MAQVGDIEAAVVGRPVRPYDAAPVDGEDDRKLLETDVLDYLVETPLEERRVHGDEGPHPAERHGGRKGNAVRLRYAYIVKTAWKDLREFFEARAQPHSGSDGYYPFVLRREPG